jgi:hypothetical protein
MTVSINGSSGIVFNDASTQNTSPFTGGFAMRNRIINGAMVIDQRNAGASYSAVDNGYSLDRWKSGSWDGSAQTGKYTVQQNAAAVTPPSGFTYYLGVTSSAATSITASAQYFVAQNIEGFNLADFGFGAANASTVTLSFWVRSSLTGTFGGALKNSAGNRAYPFTFTISVANTWEQKTITIAGDTTGTWLTTNGIGMQVVFGLGVGSTFSGTASAWAASNFYSATGATSVVGTNGATFYITGVQLEKGSTATSFDYRPYGTELALCQRYLELISGFEGSTIPSGQVGRLVYGFKVTKRAAPTVTLGALSNGTIGVSTAEGCQLQTGTAGSGPYFGSGGAKAEIEL